MHRITSTLVVGSTIALGAAFITMLMTEPRSSDAAPVLTASSAVAIPEPIVIEEVPTSTLRETLIRLNLDASSLAAAGASSQSIGLVVGAVRQQLLTASGLLESLDAEIGQGQNTVDHLERRIRAGTNDEADLQTVMVARAATAAAAASRAALFSTLTTDAVASLDETTRTRLQAIRTSTAPELATEYRVVSRTEAEWVALRDALAHERWALSNGYQVDPEPAALLLQVRSDTAVSSAISNLQSNGPAIVAAWNLATQ